VPRRVADRPYFDPATTDPFVRGLATFSPVVSTFELPSRFRLRQTAFDPLTCDMSQSLSRLTQWLDVTASNFGPAVENPLSALGVHPPIPAARWLATVLKTNGAHPHFLRCHINREGNHTSLSATLGHILLIRITANHMLARLPKELRIEVYRHILGEPNVVSVSDMSTTDHHPTFRTPSNIWRPQEGSWASGMVEGAIVGTGFFAELVQEFYRRHTFLLPSLKALELFLMHDTFATIQSPAQALRRLSIPLSCAECMQLRVDGSLRYALAALCQLGVRNVQVDFILRDHEAPLLHHIQIYRFLLDDFCNRGYRQGEMTPAILDIFRRDGNLMKERLVRDLHDFCGGDSNLVFRMGTVFPAGEGEVGVFSPATYRHGLQKVLYYEEVGAYNRRRSGEGDARVL